MGFIAHAQNSGSAEPEDGAKFFGGRIFFLLKLERKFAHRCACAILSKRGAKKLTVYQHVFSFGVVAAQRKNIACVGAAEFSGHVKNVHGSVHRQRIISYPVIHVDPSFEPARRRTLLQIGYPLVDRLRISVEEPLDYQIFVNRREGVAAIENH